MWASLSFRYKLALISTAAVVATLLCLVIPVYVYGRSTLATLHGQQLLAIARTAAVAVPPDSLNVIAGRQGQNTQAFLQARELVKDLWTANGGSLSELANGIFVVRRLPSGTRYKYLVHSSWNAGQPQYLQQWAPPTSIGLDMIAGRAAYTPVYRDERTGERMITAAAPIRGPIARSSNGASRGDCPRTCCQACTTTTSASCSPPRPWPSPMRWCTTRA